MPYKDKAAQKAYGRKHYLANKQKYIESNKNRRQQLKTFVKNLKEKTSCKDCGINYPHYVMDFDHLYDKESLIKKLVTNNNRNGLLKEIKKCEIVCSNCHRQRTHQRSLKKKL